MAVSDLLSIWPLLRLATILLSIISLIMLAILLPRTRPGGDLWEDGDGAAWRGVPLIGNCWSILHNSAIVTVTFLLGHDVYHPGIDVALDLLGWLMNWSTAICLFVWSGHMNSLSSYCNPSYEYTDGECDNERTVFGMEISSGVFTLAVGTIHLGCFIKACVETHHLRVAAERAKFRQMSGARHV